MNMLKGRTSNTRRGKLNKSNVMTPLNWFVPICEGIFIPSGVLTDTSWQQIALFVVAVCMLAFYAAIYAYFAWNDPDRLQTEEYNLASQEMSLLEVIGSPQTGSAPTVTMEQGTFQQAQIPNQTSRSNE